MAYFAKVAPREEWSADRASELLVDLQSAYNVESFQMQMYQINFNHHFQSRAYKDLMGALFVKTQDVILESYGFPVGLYGFCTALVAVCEFLDDANIKSNMMLIDMAAFGSEDVFKAAGTSRDSKITAQSVGQIFRMQVEAFASEEFQEKLAGLEALMSEASGDRWWQASVRDQLTMDKQREILARCGMQGSVAMVHGIFQICSQHIFHPMVAALSMAVNLVLRNNQASCERLVARLEETILNDPMPRLTMLEARQVKKEQEAARKQRALAAARREAARREEAARRQEAARKEEAACKEEAARDEEAPMSRQGSKQPISRQGSKTLPQRLEKERPRPEMLRQGTMEKINQGIIAARCSPTAQQLQFRRAGGLVPGRQHRNLSDKVQQMRGLRRFGASGGS